MRHKSISLMSALALAAGAASIANCSSHPSGSSTGGSTSDAGADLFQADLPQVYVAKVKNILVGLPPTDAEVKQVEADPTQLKTLIDGWMMMPEYSEKMMRFFELAFQQTQITEASFIDMLPQNGIGRGPGIPSLIQNIQESFARTMLELDTEGQPLTAAMTTKRLMMTVPLMELYAFLDTYHVDDAATITDQFAAQNPTATKIVQGTMGMSNITIEQSADSTSPFFMQWYNPDVAGLTDAKVPTCDHIDPITYPVTKQGGSNALHYMLYGTAYSHQSSGGFCAIQVTKDGDLFSDADYTTWKMVTIRPPMAGEATTKFYDIGKLRTLNELVINTPRPGFFSTPAFEANWSTNQSNQFRVTLNQSLIVSTGAQVDGTDGTLPTTTSGLDAQHAPQGSACFSCHQLLDPTRAIMAATWTNAYYTQEDASQIAIKGQFAFQGVVKDVSTIDDFANILATHPLVPAAWAQKLCYYVNSSPCLPNDPEFQRVVGVFTSSNLSWSALVRELLSSPLTTNATPTMTTQSAEVVAVSRRDHLCAALNDRLGLVDVCGLSATTPTSVITQIASGLPSDGYGRGSTIPVLPNTPTLFYRAGLENICEAVAQIVIDNPPDPNTPNAKRWSSTSPNAAISDFVATLMALTPSDPRSAQAVTILTNHFTSATTTKGATASNALKSTFTAACLAPSAAGIGM